MKIGNKKREVLECFKRSSLDLQGRWGNVGVHFANDLTRGSKKTHRRYTVPCIRRRTKYRREFLRLQ